MINDPPIIIGRGTVTRLTRSFDEEIELLYFDLKDILYFEHKHILILHVSEYIFAFTFKEFFQPQLKYYLEWLLICKSLSKQSYLGLIMALISMVSIIQIEEYRKCKF